QATPGAATGAAVPDNWETALRMLFPDATIIKNHTVKGLAFSYYLPEYALAIDVNPLDQKETIWEEYYCRQEKIKFLPLTVQESSRLRHILRSLRLSLAQTASQLISYKYLTEPATPSILMIKFFERKKMRGKSSWFP